MAGLGHVLVIDDDPDVRALVRKLLEPEGLQVGEAEDGVQGLRQVYESRPDLIVLDLEMPRRDGWETLARIRELTQTPVLVVTAKESTDAAVRAVQSGADGYLVKPLDADDIRARAMRLLRRRPPVVPQESERIGDYAIERELGRGGMGEVYLARHLHLDRLVALKVLPSEVASDPASARRFTREWRLAASLQHPNIVPVYDAGEADGRLYLAMRYIPGSDLGELIDEQGALPIERTLSLLGDVALGLSAAHDAGLVHRDVKPSNVLVDGEHAYLTDFGLAQAAKSEGSASLLLAGTVSYLAPEQARGEPPDARTDVYSFGCMAFECLTGRPPFIGDSTAAVLYGHVARPAPRASLLRAELTPEVDSVLIRALAKNPDERYESVTYAIWDLGTALSPSLTAAGANQRSAPPGANQMSARPR